MFPLRIRFVDTDHAYERFHSFPPDDVDYIEGWSRKRDDDSQLILLHLANEAHLQDFLELCRQETSIAIRFWKKRPETICCWVFFRAQRFWPNT